MVGGQAEVRVEEDSNPGEILSEAEVRSAILQQLAFPLEGNSSSWRWVIGSDFHYGSDYNAIDLNYGSGSQDRDMEVKALADGLISNINTTYGSVTITHETILNKVKYQWTSTALHMSIYATNRTVAGGVAVYEVRDADGHALFEIYEGQPLDTGESYGLVAGRGPVSGGISDTAFPPHLHQEICINGKNIDLRELTERWGVQVTAWDGGGKNELPVSWNDGVWMDDAQYNLFFDRSMQVSASSAVAPVWRALHDDPNQRHVVVWDNDTDIQKWFRWDSASNNWFRSIEGKRLEWNGSTWTQE